MPCLQDPILEQAAYKEDSGAERLSVYMRLKVARSKGSALGKFLIESPISV